MVTEVEVATVSVAHQLVTMAIAIGGVLCSCIVWLFTMSSKVKNLEVDVQDLAHRLEAQEKGFNFIKTELVETKVNMANIKESLTSVGGDVKEIKSFIMTNQLNGERK